MLIRMMIVEYREKVRYVREKILDMDRKQFAELLETTVAYVTTIENSNGRRLGRAKEEKLIRTANLPERFFTDKEINVFKQKELTDKQMFYRLFPNAENADITVEMVRQMIDVLTLNKHNQ